MSLRANKNASRKIPRRSRRAEWSTSTDNPNREVSFWFRTKFPLRWRPLQSFQKPLSERCAANDAPKKRFLVVEDESLIALDLGDRMERLGAGEVPLRARTGKSLKMKGFGSSWVGFAVSVQRRSRQIVRLPTRAGDLSRPVDWFCSRRSGPRSETGIFVPGTRRDLVCSHDATAVCVSAGAPVHPFLGGGRPITRYGLPEVEVEQCRRVCVRSI